MLGFESSIEILKDIEHSFDVSLLEYNNIKVWPLIKLALLQKLRHPNQQPIKNTYPNDQSVFYFIEKKQLDFLSKNKTDILFFSRTVEHTIMSDNKFYNPYIDPMIRIVKDLYRCLKFELIITKDAYNTMPRYESTYMIKPYQNYVKTNFSHTITHFTSLQRIINKLFKNQVNLDEGSIITDAKNVISWYSLFIQILSNTSPSAVFLVCYYGYPAMALIKACKDLNIKSVDIQHGRHGVMYKWYTIPVSGYDFLPDYFWCWGNAIKNDFEKNITTPTHHKAIVGGNINLSLWIKQDIMISQDALKYFNNLKQKNKIVLITMQHPDTVLPGFVYKAMKLLEAHDYFWLIRLHPLFNSNEVKTRIENLFEKYEITNFEIEYATKIPLYGLLKRCDYHITFWSSSCYESIAFGVPSIIINPVGLNFYKNEINSKIFHYADTLDKLLFFLTNNIINIDYNYYFETDLSVTMHAIHRIVNY